MGVVGVLVRSVPSQRFREGHNEVRVVDASSGERVDVALATEGSVLRRNRNGLAWDQNGIIVSTQKGLERLAVDDGDLSGLLTNETLVENPSVSGQEQLLYQRFDRVLAISSAHREPIDVSPRLGDAI